MLESIRDYFDSRISASRSATASNRTSHSAELATAALLLEVIQSDANIDPAERQAVLRAVRGHFNLSEEESESLLRLAAEELRQAGDYYQFTALINQHFDQSQKQHVIELMWQAAYSDGALVAHENHVLRRVAELLQVAPGDYAAAKTRARDAVADGWRTKE